MAQEPISGRVSVRCTGLVCHIGAVTGRGCSGNDECPLDTLAVRGVISFPSVPEPAKAEEAPASAPTEPAFEHWTCGTGYLLAERVLRIIEMGAINEWSAEAIDNLEHLADRAGPAFARRSLNYTETEHVPF